MTCLLPPLEEEQLAADTLEQTYYDAEGNEGTLEEVLSS